jgi:hypothetical protein
MSHYAGIDLSMERSHVCVVDADGRKIAAQSVDSTRVALARRLAVIMHAMLRDGTLFEA